MPFDHVVLDLPELDAARGRAGGWSQAMLAEKAGIWPSTIQELYDKGYTSSRTYEAIRAALGLEPGALIERFVTARERRRRAQEPEAAVS